MGILQRLARTRTGGLLFGAAQCGKRPSPAMIEVFLDVFLQQAHASLVPIVRAFAREDRYPEGGRHDPRSLISESHSKPCRTGWPDVATFPDRSSSPKYGRGDASAGRGSVR
ncbi:hypothetical protein [Streptomyces sp. NPDC003697]